MSFDEALDSIDSFRDLLHRRRVRNSNKSFCSETRTVRDHSLFFLEQPPSEVAGRLQVFLQTAAYVRKRIERALGLAAFESRDLTQRLQQPRSALGVFAEHDRDRLLRSIECFNCGPLRYGIGV